VEQFLSRGDDPHVACCSDTLAIQRSTPLVCAVRHGHLSCVEALLAFEPNMAEKEAHKEALNFLSACAEANPAGCVRILELLLEHGAGRWVNEQRALLMMIDVPSHADEEKCVMVEMLLKAGADPYERVSDFAWQDHTPLHSAAYSGNAALVEVFCRWGMNVDTREGGEGAVTPLFAGVLVIAEGLEDSTEHLEVLCRYGADPYLKLSRPEGEAQNAIELAEWLGLDSVASKLRMYSRLQVRHKVVLVIYGSRSTLLMQEHRQEMTHPP